jgi:hypothetical protein
MGWWRARNCIVILDSYQAPQSLTHGQGDETVMARRGPSIHVFDI